MKKIILIFAAMLAVAQMNAATNDAANNSEATPEPAAATTASDDDSNRHYDHPFVDDDESTEHWTFTTNGFYFGMGVKHDWEAINNSFEIGLLNIAAVKYNSLHGQVLTLGCGIHHRSYSMKRPTVLVRDNGNRIITEVYPSDYGTELKNRSSNLNLWTLQFPLMFKQKIVKKLDLGVAGILNWNTYARVDNHYELNNIEYDVRYKKLHQNKVNFDFMGTLTWSDMGFYCRYSPGKFFKDGYGPEIKKTWTVGLMFLL